MAVQSIASGHVLKFKNDSTRAPLKRIVANICPRHRSFKEDIREYLCFVSSFRECDRVPNKFKDVLLCDSIFFYINHVPSNPCLTEKFCLRIRAFIASAIEKYERIASELRGVDKHRGIVLMD